MDVVMYFVEVGEPGYREPIGPYERFDDADAKAREVSGAVCAYTFEFADSELVIDYGEPDDEEEEDDS